MDIRKLQRAIVDGLEDVKAQDILVFNTEHLSPLFERVIIATGSSNRQTKSLASSVRDAVKSRGLPLIRTEGEENGEWIIVDCGAAVCHIMQPAIRQYYHLEEIWGGKPVKIKLATLTHSLVKASETLDDLDDEAELSPAKQAAAKKTARPAQAKTAAKRAPAKKASTKAAPSRKTPSKAAPAGKSPARKTSPSEPTGRVTRTVVVQSGVAARKPASKTPAKTAKTSSKASARAAAALPPSRPAGSSSGKSPAKTTTGTAARKSSTRPAR